MKSLLISAAVLSISMSTFASDKGNGGAGICRGETCVTLAQAGFRIKDPREYQMGLRIPEEVLDELDRVVSIIAPLLSKLQKNPHSPSPLSSDTVIGTSDTLKFIAVEDDATSRYFLDQYRRTLAANGDTTHSSELEVLGFTSNGVTFLIDTKFERLTPKGAALLLLHEYFLRDRDFDLTQVLTLDGAIVDYLKHSDLVAFLNTVQGLPGIEEDKRKAFLFNAIVYKNGKLKLTPELAAKVYTYGSKHLLRFDEMTFLRIRKSYPESSLLLGHQESGLELNDQRRVYPLSAGIGRSLRECIQNSSSGTCTLSNANFKAFVGNHVSLKHCGDFYDQSKYFIGNAGLEFATYVDCSNGGGLDYIPVARLLSSYRIYARLNGENLNLISPLTCRLQKATFSKDADSIICE